MEMGDCIETTVDKKSHWHPFDFVVPAGTRGVVCDVLDDEVVQVEIYTLKEVPFALVTFEKGEYVKIEP